MVINNLHITSITFIISETQTPPIIYPYTVLAFTVSHQGFKTISRRDLQKTKCRGSIQLGEFTLGNSFNRDKSTQTVPLSKFLRVPAPISPNHIKRYIEYR